MADCRGSDHERAIGDGFCDGFEFFRLSKQGGGAYGGAGILKRDIVRIHHPQMKKSKVTHCPGGSANIERIARVHEDHAQMIEFSGNRQAGNILRQPAVQRRLIGALLMRRIP